MANHIDCTLNFLKSRKEKPDPFILFRDVQNSVATTSRKTLTFNQFRQILHLVPDLYDHKWAVMPVVSQKEPVLTICFKTENDLPFLNHEELRRR